MTGSSSTITWLRWVALAEALSYVALLVAVVVKYGFDRPVGVDVMGPIHGMLFLAYAGLVLLARDDLRWGGGQTLVAMIAAVIPLGGLAVERRMIPERRTETGKGETGKTGEGNCAGEAGDGEA